MARGRAPVARLRRRPAEKTELTRLPPPRAREGDRIVEASVRNKRAARGRTPRLRGRHELCGCRGSRASVGGMKAPRSASAPSSSTPTHRRRPALEPRRSRPDTPARRKPEARAPYTTSASRSSFASCSRTSRRCGQRRDRPHLHLLRVAGHPRPPCPSAARNASMTSPAIAAGTIALRIAVHFGPAFTVISRTTSRTNRSSSRRSGHRVRARGSTSSANPSPP